MNKIDLYIYDKYTEKYISADLYEDETITLNSAIKDYKRLDKAISDYTQNFNLPATAKNNKIFRYFYSHKVSDGFDSRYRVKAVMKVNGEDFKEGEISLLGVSSDFEIASSYNVVFYSNISVVSNLIGDDKLENLPYLDKYSHDYNFSNIVDIVQNGAYIPKGYTYLDLWQESDITTLVNGSASADFINGVNKDFMQVNVTVADDYSNVRFRTETYSLPVGSGLLEGCKMRIKYSIKVEDVSQAYRIRHTLTSIDSNTDNTNTNLSNTLANVWEEKEFEFDLQDGSISDIQSVRVEFFIGLNTGLYQIKDTEILIYGGDATDTLVIDTDGLTRTSRVPAPDLIYPFVSATNRYYYDSTETALNIKKTRNVKCSTAIADRYKGIYWKDLKPALRNEVIFKAIESKYGVSFEGSLFEYGSPLLNSYVLFQRESGSLDKTIKLKEATYLFNDDLIDNGDVGIYDDIYINSLSPKDYSYDTVSFDLAITGTGSFSVSLVDNSTGHVYYEVNNRDELDLLYSFEAPPIQGSSYEPRYKLSISSISDGITGIDISNINLRRNSYDNGSFLGATDKAVSDRTLEVGLFADMQNLLSPNISVANFLKSVFKMYNVIAIVKGTTITCEPLNVYMLDKEYNTYDITDYAEIDKITTNRVEVFREIDLKHKEAKNIFNVVSNQASNDVFGSERYYNEGDKVFDGGKLEVKTDFSLEIYEELFNTSNGVSTDLDWGFNVSEDENSIRQDNLIFFTEPKDVSALNIRLTNVNEDTPTDTTTSDYLAYMWSPKNYLDFFIERYSLAFGSEFSTDGNINIEESLYNKYYKDYINNIYQKGAKILILDCYLPSFLITKINMNDRIVFDNSRFIINSMKSNLKTGKVSFELMTDTYVDSASLKGGAFSNGFSNGFNI